MGARNVLVEGVSGTGKTTVAIELERRGHHVVHGDRVLAYQGNPQTGEPRDGLRHEHHVWDVSKVAALAARRDVPATFFCGGSRNHHRFIHLFDAVFILDVDRSTLLRRLASRGEDEYGGRPHERAHVARLHETGEDLPPDGIRIDATGPVHRVVDAILERCGPMGQGS